MGIVITKVGVGYNFSNTYEYNCLTTSDLASLPTTIKTGVDKDGNILKKCAIGSLAFVSGTEASPVNKVYKLNSVNEWVELPSSSGGSGTAMSIQNETLFITES